LGKGEKKGKWRVIKEEGGEDRGKREKGEVNMGSRESLLLVIVFSLFGSAFELFQFLCLQN
jgi:hypothetical protein